MVNNFHPKIPRKISPFRVGEKDFLFIGREKRFSRFAKETPHHLDHYKKSLPLGSGKKIFYFQLLA